MDKNRQSKKYKILFFSIVTDALRVTAITIGYIITKVVFLGYRNNQNNQKKASSVSIRDANRRSIKIGSPDNNNRTT
jgi:hypothetical protein